jgi:hypothetical protein
MIDQARKLMKEPEMITQKQLNETLEARIPPVAWDATVAIVIEINRTLRQFGTGTLLKIADQLFVVTAAHVIRQAKKLDGSLCLAGKKGTYAPADGEWFFSTEGQYGTHVDPFDVAVLPLAEHIADKLGTSVFLRLHDVCFDEDFAGGIYCLYGFPTLWASVSTEATPVMVAKPFQYVSYAFEGTTTQLSEYQERFHLLLTADPAETTDLKGDRQVFRTKENFPAKFPDDIGGISGCSVWKIGDRRIPLAEWKRFAPKVVAVETSVYARHKIIKATKWIAVTTLLSVAFPELKSAILLCRKDTTFNQAQQR